MRRPYKSQLKRMTPPDPSLEDRIKEVIDRRSPPPQPIERKSYNQKGERYNRQVHPMVVTYLRRDGADENEIAKVLGITRRTLDVWCATHPEVMEAMNTSALGVCESVTRALYSSAIGREVTDIERVYETRTNPVTRKPEKVLVREKEVHKTVLPNPLSCFFYLQNRDASRWQPAGGKGDKGTGYTPEQVALMMRTSAGAIADATIAGGLFEETGS